VLLLELDESVTFDALRTAIRNRFTEMETWRGRDARLDLGEKNIDLFDLRRLVHVLKDEFDVTVAGLYCEQSALNQFAERELKIKVYPRGPTPLAVEAAEPVDTPSTNDSAVTSPTPSVVEAVEVEKPTEVERTLFNDTLYQESQTEKVLTLKRSLRSGQKIRYAGDVVLYGDVNPGAEVIAGGNILVMGKLKGLCHAGARGDDGALIIAFDFRPAQVRIGRKIAIPPDRGPRATRTYAPEIAWVRGGEILIEAYAGHLPQ
jgi:septum site-determining protein MinC